MAELFVNSGDPDRMLHSVAFDLGLHCLPNSLGEAFCFWAFSLSVHMSVCSSYSFCKQDILITICAGP